MRSRFTAFALSRADHLLASWHPETRPDPDELRASLDGSLRWTRLVVHDADGGGPDDAEGIVEFTAIARDADGAKVRLRERSLFARYDGRWVYVDADVSA